MSMGSASVATKPFLFYILMDASTIQQNNLRVPKKFVKKCGNKLSSVATLVLPSGDDWLVRLKEVDGKLWFTAGWHEFMVHFSICAGYFLVFKYEGDSIFKVSIFNLTAYEVDYRDKPVGKGKQFSVSNGKEIGNDPCPTFAIKSDVLEGGLDPKMLCGNCKSNLFLTKDADNSQARPRSTQDIGIQFNGNEIDGIMQLLNQAGARQTKRKQRNEPSNPAKETEMPSRKVSKMNEDVSGAEIPERERTLLSAQEFKPSNPHCCIVKRPTFISLDSQLTRDIGVEFKTSTEELKLRSSIEQKVKKTVRKKWKSDGQEPSTEHKEGGKIRYRYYESASARKRSVPAEERERAINAAKAFEPNNPFCWVVLRPSYLYRGCIMNLPSCFAEKHLIGVSGFIKLQTSDGRQWPVWCLYKGGKAKLRQGWFDFALENCIREGDVCVFELLRMEEVVLQVTVFRVTEDC